MGCMERDVESPRGNGERRGGVAGDRDRLGSACQRLPCCLLIDAHALQTPMQIDNHPIKITPPAAGMLLPPCRKAPLVDRRLESEALECRARTLNLCGSDP